MPCSPNPPARTATPTRTAVLEEGEQVVRRPAAESEPHTPPGLAFSEQHGIPGLRALEETLAAIPAGIPVIGDIKRGDVGNTAEAYARAAFEIWKFDAVTVNGYQGLDTVAPFLAYEGKGVYVLCRTSNPSSREFQEQPLANGTLLFEHVAVTAAGWSPAVGLVVGATAPAELRRASPPPPLAGAPAARHG